MELQEADVRAAFKIFVRLLEKGVIKEQERDFHYDFQRTEIRYILEEIIEREAEVKIFAAGGNLYLTPGVDNRLFGYTNAELRERLGLRSNSELYLAYFAILNMLAKFYNSDDQSLASRQFLPLDELEEAITAHVDRVLALDPEQVEEQEEALGMNLRAAAEVWLDMPAFDASLSNLGRARNNRISFLLRVLRFLEEEGLAQVLEERELRLLPKMEHLVLKYYYNSQRKDYLLQLLANGVSTRAAD